MRKINLFIILFACMFMCSFHNGYSQIIQSVNQITTNAVQFEKSEFKIEVTGAFTNPYAQEQIALDMLLTSPTGKSIILPCFYESGDSDKSVWRARFAAQELGNFNFQFQLKLSGTISATTDLQEFTVAPSATDGFIHANDKSTFKFDSGKPFRGVGENIGWPGGEYTYEVMLNELSENGGNFFRTWMWKRNLPLEYKHSNGAYYNTNTFTEMDNMIELSESLDLYIMLTLVWHGALMNSESWSTFNYNSVNGGPVDTPAEFFTNEEAKLMFKNRLRFIVARWGYSTSICAWEFFNEVDNAVWPENIPHADVTSWHNEMSTYLTEIDPYDHLITTSVSHREIDGLFNVENIDFIQRHIYKYTGTIPSFIDVNITKFDKPFVVGEFGYEWDWELDFSNFEEELDFDFKRGFWYGMFSETPILPMSWWWEFFYDRDMMDYFRGVSIINNKMIDSGDGSFEKISISSSESEKFATKCGTHYYAYLLNTKKSAISTNVTIDIPDNTIFMVETFDPTTLKHIDLGEYTVSDGKLQLENISLNSRKEIIIIAKPKDDTQIAQEPETGLLFSIPGVIEAENFDLGGEGLAYHDYEETNTGGVLRTEDGVDIAKLSDDNYCITNIIRGEWIEYSVNIEKRGMYKINVNVASDTDGNSFHIELDGQKVSGIINVPNTGGIDAWQNVEVISTVLNSGDQVLRVYFDSDNFYLDNIELIFDNISPLISLTSPLAGSSVSVPSEITIEADCSDEDGTISKVEFYNGKVKIGESLSAPYTLVWSTVPDIKLSAIAYDDKGASTISEYIDVLTVISEERAPYSGTPYEIPGKIEAENYDVGFKGITYSDLSDGNKFELYRTDDVDIEECVDVDGGYNLGDLQTNEWVEYTVTVTKDGLYNIDFRVATEMEDTKFHLEMDNKDISGTIIVSNTKGWQQWETFNVSNIPLEAGEQVLKLVIEGQYFNLNYMKFNWDSEVSKINTNGTYSDDIIVYPNPATDILNFDNNVQKVMIFDLTGKKVLSQNNTTGNVNIQTLPSGLYQVLLYSSFGYKAQKVVIEK